MNPLIQTAITESISTKQNLPIDVIETTGQCVIACFKTGGKVVLAGNGGSAADAQHIAAEWVGRFIKERPGLPAIALSCNTSAVTAIGNDYGYDKTFVRGIEAFGQKGDVFIGISTSGNSANICEAVTLANQKGMITIGLTGAEGGALKTACTHCVCVPSKATPRIQESHILIGHIWCALVDEAIG